MDSSSKERGRGWKREEETKKWSMRRWQRTFKGLCNQDSLWSSRVNPAILLFLPPLPTILLAMSGYRLEYAPSARSKCKGQLIFPVVETLTNGSLSFVYPKLGTDPWFMFVFRPQTMRRSATPPFLFPSSQH